MSQSMPDQHRWSRDDVARLLTSHTALVDLDHDSARTVVHRMTLQHFKTGDILMQEGVARSGAMMLVLQGEVVVEQQNLRRADSLILGVVGPGSVLGEMSLLDGEPRSATCKAFKDVEVATLERDVLAAMMETEPKACAKLLAVLLKRVSSRLRIANGKIRALSQANQALSSQTSGRNASPAQAPVPPDAQSDTGMILL